MSKNLKFLEVNVNESTKSETVVRVETSYWTSKRGLHSTKSVKYLRRKSTGYNILEEDIGMSDAEGVFKRIVNIDTCVDGIYRVICCDVQRDWETGNIDDYNYQLVPWKGELTHGK
jgi:hypothetical protein